MSAPLTKGSADSSISRRSGKRISSRLTILGKSRTLIPHSPGQARLETFPNAYPRRDYWINFECPEFTALCPITGQPDFGVINIAYIPGRLCLESKSLKLYLFAFRNYGAFHETAVNRILDDIAAVCRPRRLRVGGRFNARGGITISVTAEYPAADGGKENR